MLSIAGLLALQLPFQIDFLRRIEAGHPVLWGTSALAVALTVAAIVGSLRRRAWTAWPGLCATTWTATILLHAWSMGTAQMVPVGLAAIAVTFVLLVLSPAPRLPRLGIGVRLFYAAVASLTGYVTFWGLVFPNGTGWNLPFLAENFDGSLPFNVSLPTLHARVIGSLYGAATVVSLLNLVSRDWYEARIGTWMILLWTGTILGVSLAHPLMFDWTKPSVWFWFVAYLGFPAIAVWLLKRQYGMAESAVGEGATKVRRLSLAAKRYLGLQGVVLTLLACLLQFWPSVAAAVWPWALLPFLSRFYSAPLMTFGIASLLASRVSTGREARALTAALAVMAGCIAVSSWLHRDRFDFGGPAVWVWFGSLLVLGLSNLAIATSALLPQRGPSAGTPQASTGITA
jgi:hypothetical protein